MANQNNTAVVFSWFCPSCDAENHDEIDPVDGPFFTCTCGNCSHAFGQDEVPRIALGKDTAMGEDT